MNRTPIKCLQEKCFFVPLTVTCHSQPVILKCTVEKSRESAVAIGRDMAATFLRTLPAHLDFLINIIMCIINIISFHVTRERKSTRHTRILQICSLTSGHQYWRSALDLSEPGYGPMEGSFERGNKTSSSRNMGNSLTSWATFGFYKDFALWIILNLTVKYSLWFRTLIL